jgi:hypothetical protein
MKKKRMLLSVLVLFAATNIYAAEEKKLGATFDLTYMSRYMSKGFSPYGPRGAFFETTSVDLWDTGFGVSVGHQSALGSGYVNKHRFNYGVYYGNSFFKDKIYETKIRFDWIYKDYYKRASEKSDAQNLIFDFSWPNILPIKNLSPYYVADYEYPAGRNYANRTVSGFVHRFGLAYNLTIPGLPKPLKLTAETAYNDGFNNKPSQYVDHDWSYSTFGIATVLPVTKNLSFVPALYQQITMDRSVNSKHDITYCKISMKYKF